MGFGLFDVVLRSQRPQATSAAEAVLCELTVAASGLAFCDKVVGTGPQAVKGQLIKVTNNYLKLRLFVVSSFFVIESITVSETLK